MAKGGPERVAKRKLRVLEDLQRHQFFRNSVLGEVGYAKLPLAEFTLKLVFCHSSQHRISPWLIISYVLHKTVAGFVPPASS